MIVATNRAPAKRDAIWAAIRILRTFTHSRVTMTSEASRAEVQRYLQGLRQAGIVRITHKANRTKGIEQTMQLARDLGPLTPRVRRSGAVYDPNSHTVFGGADG